MKSPKSFRKSRWPAERHQAEIRFFFFRTQSARGRTFVISRRRLGFMAGLLAVISIAGYWLILTGYLHPGKEVVYRDHLIHQNKKLGNQVMHISRGLDSIRLSLHWMKQDKVNEILRKGIGYSETDLFAEKKYPHSGNVDKLIQSVRTLSTKFDSAISILKGDSLLAEKLPTGYPLASLVATRGYGFFLNPFTGRKAMHGGVDFAGTMGERVLSTGGGEVEKVGKHPFWGKYVTISHTENVESYYAHLGEISVKRGQKVKRGTGIGEVGATGVTTGPHLHYEIRLKKNSTNPFDFLLLTSQQVVHQNSQDQEFSTGDGEPL